MRFILSLILAVPLDEWDLARADLNLPSVSSAEMSVDGNQTFSFSRPVDFELKYDPDEVYPERELLVRGEVTQICLKSVVDPTKKYLRDWCHTKFSGTVSYFIYGWLGSCFS